MSVGRSSDGNAALAAQVRRLVTDPPPSQTGDDRLAAISSALLLTGSLCDLAAPVWQTTFAEMAQRLEEDTAWRQMCAVLAVSCDVDLDHDDVVASPPVDVVVHPVAAHSLAGGWLLTTRWSHLSGEVVRARMPAQLAVWLDITLARTRPIRHSDDLAGPPSGRQVGLVTAAMASGLTCGSGVAEQACQLWRAGEPWQVWDDAYTAAVQLTCLDRGSG